MIDNQMIQFKYQEEQMKNNLREIKMQSKNYIFLFFKMIIGDKGLPITISSQNCPYFYVTLYYACKDYIPIQIHTRVHFNEISDANLLGMGPTQSCTGVYPFRHIDHAAFRSERFGSDLYKWRSSSTFPLFQASFPRRLLTRHSIQGFFSLVLDSSPLVVFASRES